MAYVMRVNKRFFILDSVLLKFSLLVVNIMCKCNKKIVIPTSACRKTRFYSPCIAVTNENNVTFARSCNKDFVKIIAYGTKWKMEIFGLALRDAPHAVEAFAI